MGRKTSALKAAVLLEDAGVVYCLGFSRFYPLAECQAILPKQCLSTFKIFSIPLTPYTHALTNALETSRSDKVWSG